MPQIRTKTRSGHGHREFTLIAGEQAAREPAPLVGYLESTAAANRPLEPGDVFQIGTSLLRVIDRPDGTLGIEERTGAQSWVEQVDRCLEHLRIQIHTADKLGVFDEVDFPTDNAITQFRPCALAGAEVFMTRSPMDDPQHSGWYVVCVEDHDHDEWQQSDLLALMQSMPTVTPFLGLPPGTTVQLGPSLSGQVRASVWRGDFDYLTPEGGSVFESPATGVDAVSVTQRPEQTPLARAIVKFNDCRYRTSVGAEYDHREITVLYAEKPLVKGMGDWVLDYFQNAIVKGTRFEPGETIGIGWSQLRVTARNDGTLGLEEQVGPDRWLEQIDNTVRDTWYQKEVAASVGLVERMAFPGKQQTAAVAQCVVDGAQRMTLRRHASNKQDESGWEVTCDSQHAHGERIQHTLLELADMMPFAVQFFALPDKVSVLVESPEVSASGRIRAQVEFDGQQLVAEPGSYLAAVNG